MDYLDLHISLLLLLLLLLYVGVTELRSVHVHMLDLRNNGNMILTKRKE